jgi:NAD(P)-dependent dehydrogenase (short-subunit alcohol dehydrogenase family)
MMTEQQVVIIGGSEGIGLAIAKAARTLGARVLAVSRTREQLEAARDAVSGLEIRVADINSTALIQDRLTTRSTTFATNSMNVSGARLTWFAPRIVSCVPEIRDMKPIPVRFFI